MVDVPLHFGGSQGQHLAVPRHALVELSLFRLAEYGFEIGTAHHDDLQQLGVLALEVRQEADLLQHVRL